jgi:hypothetical protein
MKIIVQLLQSSKRSTSFLDKICKTRDPYVDIYYYAKLPSHNWQSIRDLKRKISEFSESLHLVHGNNRDLTIFQAQTSNFCYPKYHAMAHLIHVRDLKPF